MPEYPKSYWLPNDPRGLQGRK